MLPLNHNDKFFKVVAVSGKSPYSTLLVQTAPGKGRIIELKFGARALPEWNLESLIRAGYWHDNFEPFDNKTLDQIKHLIDTAEN
jgi:hypothetical protein